jgi:hypothetical protein
MSRSVDIPSTSTHMSFPSNRMTFLLLGASLLTGCNRQYATYRPTTATVYPAPTVADGETLVTQPKMAEAAPATLPAADAMWRNEAAPMVCLQAAARLARVQTMLAAPVANKVTGVATTKLTFAQRAVVKLLNRRIGKRLALRSPLAPQGLCPAVVNGVLAG